MPYNQPLAEDIEQLAAIVGPERCLTGDNINPDYGHDELGGAFRLPEVLLLVAGTDEVSAILRLADKRRIPVTARGAGTGLVGGAVAAEGGIMLDTTRMNRILEVDPDNLTATVQPGVPLLNLTTHVEGMGLFYPPDPGEKSATIGGNINTNAGGMRAVKYGVTRDYVRGLTAVLPGGEVIVVGGKTVKNSTGYSLKDLLVGSEGTLAVITEAVLRLLPLPAYSVSLLIPFPSMETALETVPDIVRAKATPTAIEYMARETILFAEKHLDKKFPDTQYPAYLLLTFDGGDREQVETGYAAVAEMCLERGAADVFLVDTEERKKSVWGTRAAFLEAIRASTSQIDECDVVVPRSRVADYIKFTQALSEKVGLRLPSFGHAGDGNLHLYLCRDDLDAAEWERRSALAFGELYGKAREMGGLVSGEHGIGSAKRKYLQEQCGDTQIALMRSIKTAFDPHGILNPGKICR